MSVDSKPTLIGLMTDQNPDLLVGMIGILKSDGAFVPIDPKYPASRIEFIIKDCAIEVLVTERKWEEKASQAAQSVATLKHIVYLDELCDDGEEATHAAYDRTDDGRANNPPQRSASHSPDDPLYVIYTSGSTGTPKGVPITHANLVPLLLWSKEYFNLGEHTRVLQNLSYSFDFGVYELLTTLLFGGTLHFLHRYGVSRSSGYADFIRDHAINTIHSTPSFFKEMIASKESLDSLEILHLGGEQLTRTAVDEILEAVGERCRVFNGYGPTEASVNSTIFAAGGKSSRDPLEREASRSIPIGRATANNRAYVLDKNFGLSPVGVAGELYIGGQGLSSGYLNQPELTAERFVPDYFGNEPGARLYRSGDLVRWLADGNIEFLGRVDHQVKVRGLRIEPGEIEALLVRHPDVREAVVMAREDEPGNKRLVAYVIPANGQPAAQLRGYLREKLPDYMIPSAFITLEELPLTPNGKVDLRALPAPDRSRPGMEDSFVPPRTPEEEVVGGVCAEMLGLESVGVFDDLFNLGCHSLLATKIVVRLREVFQVDIPLLAIFEGPTVASLAETIRQVLLAGQSSQPPALRPFPRTQHAPLSFAQERLWFLSKLDPESTSYYIPRAIEITGPFAVAALELTFTEIVRRHEILRTTFPTIDGNPVQVIHPPYDFAVAVIDLRGLPADEREALTARLIIQVGQQAFDLEKGAMLRVNLLRLAEREYVLVLTEHHLVHDGWTQGVLVRDFLTIYTAFASGEPSPLPELPIQYADFACWQREWMRGEVLAEQLSYWTKQLAGAPPLLTLPSDRPRPAAQSFRGSEQVLVIDTPLAESLRSLSRREGATLFMVMLAAFKTLLYRYTGQEDLVVGSGIANRRWQETEDLLGMIINTLVLRTDLSGAPGYSELLRRVRNVCLGAYAHQDLPFERLVEELQPQRSLSYNPVFQVMFAFMDAPTPELHLPGLTMSVMDAHNRSAKFDLNVVVIPHAEQHIGQQSSGGGSEITMLLEYATDIFEADTITRMFGHFKNLLQSIVEDPAKPILALEMLSEGERRQLLMEWNQTESEFPRDKCIHQSFEEQAARAPDAIAVTSGGLRLTYGELNSRAARLARRLRDMGVGPEVCVGVCMERSHEMIVGLLGILKAGGFYMPMDPTYPAERLSLMLEDSHAPVVLTEQSLVEKLSGYNVRAVCLNAEWGEAEPLSAAPYGDEAMAENLACVIYTSGSTGRPKGVCITHRAISRMVFNTNYIEVDASDRIAQASTLSFDAATFEIWATLLHGAGLIIITKDVVVSPKELAAQVNEQGLSKLFLTTALFNQMGKELPSAFGTLDDLMFGGETADPTSTRNVLKADPPGRLLHLYGPTESTTFATWHLVDEVEDAATTVPIGSPISNTQVYLLDPDLQPVPVGVSGEIYIGGEGLARCYLGRAGLTAEKFTPDPYGRRHGGRLYRTGDIALYRASGEIEFLGRNDFQVKIRGLRIELGEIESVLTQQAGVLKAVVVAREDTPGDKRLVAYVVVDQQQPPTAAELRNRVKQHLPGFMTPSVFVFLDAMPLTTVGKLDRNALPAPDQTRPELGVNFEPPRNAVEEILATIWVETLGVERVGIHDNFFELGGHSLLATRVQTRMRETFKVELSLRCMFEGPTIAQVAGQVEEALLKKIEQLSEEEAQRLVSGMFPAV